jgi:hypothetical protein
MTVRKLSISLDAEAFERAKRAANAEGVSLSSWLSRAAQDAAAVSESRAALAEYLAAYGEPDDAELAAARAELAELGVGQPEPTGQTAARAAALARLRGHIPSPRQTG